MIQAIDQLNSNAQSGVGYTLAFTPKTAPAQDSVVLSLDAKVQLLEQQGLTIGEIADQLGIATSTVQADLGIPLTSAQTKVATA
jgi:predicted DNA-binding protein (UPF0251 family)